MKMYVGNLSYSVTADDLKEAFSAYGTVATVDLITDRDSGQSKGFGFVEMENNSEADAAIKGMNGSSLQGRNIKVNQAQPKTNSRPQRRRY
ncbi:RNA-binding protein [Endozoicomonas sp. SM1973]|uniref:RNA-binding protein n=1 Tax=Spartinivicinus marinus TaxID=2994442 RepID=A0A853IDV4_9GAMM|nr:RNA-binding protein [Spartinivicinus marinus]MCX4027890.1 RNA-binding protein [Spartinivicinus marinus]MCX4027958.1 RNA-binding protein [Spartinivicinus marinus]NYZ68234.1 RNA-binding protein [Spartinivicinus marinus]NYZ69449.1 RNA-binding protein [Spartinivicinus marinus]